MLNSNLMDVLNQDQLDVAIVYSGNPCLLAIVQTLGLPFVYVDLEGLSKEIVIASGMPWPLPSLGECQSVKQCLDEITHRLSVTASFLGEWVAQSGNAFLAGAVSKRYRQLDGPIDSTFANDYEIRKRFNSKFPSITMVFFFV
jgi:hypothetical protein